jgi:NMT1/THI5 like
MRDHISSCFTLTCCALNLFVLCLLPPSPASAQAPSPLLVAYAGQNETAGPMWVGIEKGSFKKYGLDVRMVQLRTGALSMATLASGQVQFVYGSPANALSATAGEMKIQCAASPIQKIPREQGHSLHRGIARESLRRAKHWRRPLAANVISLDNLGIDPEKYKLNYENPRRHGHCDPGHQRRQCRCCRDSLQLQ